MYNNHSGHARLKHRMAGHLGRPVSFPSIVSVPDTDVVLGGGDAAAR